VFIPCVVWCVVPLIFGCALWGQAFCRYRVLPQLTSALEFGAGLSSFSSILTSVLKIGTLLTATSAAAASTASASTPTAASTSSSASSTASTTPTTAASDEYSRLILPSLLKLFSSTERAVRIQLLQRLDEYIAHVSDRAINEGGVWGHVVTGFTDQSGRGFFFFSFPFFVVLLLGADLIRSTMRVFVCVCV
jgi:hypothetical protein